MHGRPGAFGDGLCGGLHQGQQRLQEFECVLVAQRRIFLEAAGDDAAELITDLRPQLSDPRRHLLELQGEHQRNASAREGSATDEEFKEGGADGVDVSPGVDDAATDLLGSHVQGCAQHGAFAGHREGMTLVEMTSDAEVDELHLRACNADCARGPLDEDHVLGFEVTVHDAVVVNVDQCPHQIDDQVDGVAFSTRSAVFDDGLEILAFDQLRDEIKYPAFFSSIEVERDAGVVQFGQQARFFAKALDGLGRRSPLVFQQLDSNAFAGVLIDTAKDLAHGSFAEHSNKAEAADAFRMAGLGLVVGFGLALDGGGVDVGRPGQHIRPHAAFGARSIGQAFQASRAVMEGGARGRLGIDELAGEQHEGVLDGGKVSGRRGAWMGADEGDGSVAAHDTEDHEATKGEGVVDGAGFCVVQVRIQRAREVIGLSVAHGAQGQKRHRAAAALAVVAYPHRFGVQPAVNDSFGVGKGEGAGQLAQQGHRPLKLGPLRCSL